MSISRRSFLKIAGLTTVAVAGTALFAGCSVASYLQVELDEAARNVILNGIGDDISDEQKDKANQILDAYVSFVNLGLMLCPMVGVTELPVKDAYEKINEAIDKAVEKYPDQAETAAKIKEWIDKFEIVAPDGKIVAEGSVYTKMVVKVTAKSTDVHALSEALAAAV